MDVFSTNRYAIGLNPNINLKQIDRNINFGTIPTSQDRFESNSVTRLFNEQMIRNLINQNPEVKKFLNEHDIPVNLNMAELIELKENHCKDTAEIAGAIVKNLPPLLRQQLKIDIKTLKDGAMLHDFGKVLIPAEILNKPASFTPQEHEIMKLHAELGYQLLKNSGVNDEVLNLVRYHHSNIDNNGNFIPDIHLQILNLADKYSALTEKRVYKDEFSPQKALTIIQKEVQEGKVNPQLFQALVRSVNNTQSPTIVNKY